MPNPLSGPPAATWSSKAAPDSQLRERWLRADCRTHWAHCGRQWDAVALELRRGLASLDALDLRLDQGYPVLADYLTNRLYVLVAPGTARMCEEIRGARVLSAGAQILLPVSGASAAHWISAPHGSQLIDAGQLADALLRLTDALAP